MLNEKITFQYSRSTKNKHVYEETRDVDRKPLIGTLYVSKELERFDALEVTLGAPKPA